MRTTIFSTLNGLFHRTPVKSLMRPKRDHELPAHRFSRDHHSMPLLNFGVLEQSGPYTLYRSGLLGKWGLKLLKAHLQRQKLPFPKTIVYMNYEGYGRGLPFIGHFALEEYLLQNEYGHNFIHPFGEVGNTYLDGFNPYHPVHPVQYPFNSPEEQYLGSSASKIFAPFLRKSRTEVPYSTYTSFRNIENFYRIMKMILETRNQPVLFHCLAGKHRTGMVALTFRYLQGGDWIEGKHWPVYSSHYKKYLFLNKAQYEYYLHNPDYFRRENLDFVEHFFRHDPLFKELQEIYFKSKK